MREDYKLRTEDLKLKLFVEYTRILDDTYHDIFKYSNRSSTSIIRVSKDKNYPVDRTLESMVKRDRALEIYSRLESFIYEVVESLRYLDDSELELLYLRYECELSLRAIGDIYGYSYMQIQRMLDKVLMKM